MRVTYPASCWQQCGEVGCLSHVIILSLYTSFVEKWAVCHTCYGTVALLRPFWNNIFQILSTLIGHTVNPSIGLAILHICLKDVPITYWTLALYIPLAAKLNISSSWQNTTPPSIESVIADINYQCFMERVMSQMSNSLLKFEKAWNPQLNSPMNSINWESFSCVPKLVLE